MTIREFIKTDKMTQGIKTSDNAIQHIEHLIKLMNINDTYLDTIAIRFYIMGYATGKLEK